MQKNDYTISVIIPVFNAADYISECIESVLRQSLKKLEIIFIDDGSTDNSYNIINKYITAENIKLISTKNIGPGRARNIGIDKSNGKFIAFMDADDLYYDDLALEILYNNAIKEKAKICGGNLIIFDEDWKNGKRYNSDPKERFLKNAMIQYEDNGSMFGFTRYIYERDFVIENKIFFNEYRCWEDPVFMSTAFSLAKKFYSVDKDVYCYRRQIHRKEHRIQDAVDLLKASCDIMNIANKTNNMKLELNLLEVLNNSYENISYLFSKKPDYVISGLNSVKSLLFGDIPSELIRSIKRFNELDFKTENEQYEKDLIHLCRAIDKRKCIIYGAGEYGKRLYWLMTDYGMKPEGFAVTYIDSGKLYQFGLPIKKIDEWNNMEYRYLIAVKDISSKMEIEKSLLKNGKIVVKVSDRLLNRTIIR